MPTNRRRKKGSSEFTQGDSPVYSMDAFYIVFEKILFSFNKRNILFQDLELESGFLLSIDCPNSLYGLDMQWIPVLLWLLSLQLCRKDEHLVNSLAIRFLF